MDNFDNVQVSEVGSASDVTSTAPKSATKRSSKTGGTTARKQPKNESPESRVLPVDNAKLAQQLEDCKNSASHYQDMTNRTDNTLYRALARSYVWWRVCIQVDKRIDHYLNRAEIRVREGTREFSSLIRLTFSLNGSVKGETDKRLETKAVNRFATAMDSIHRHFVTENLTFGDEAGVAAHIREKGGVEALIQQQIAHERQNQADDPEVKKAERQSARLKLMESFFRGKDKRTSFTATDLQRGEGALVPLVGLVGENSRVDVVGIVPCSEATFENLLLNNDIGLDEVPGELNFFSEVLSLGEVIKEGMPSNYPVKDGADIARKTTERLPRERLLLVQGSNAHAVVGLARAESSIVIHAEPKFDLKWPVKCDVYMGPSSRRWYEKNVIPSTRRGDCHCEIASSDHTKDSEVCITITSPHVDKPKPLHLRDYNGWAKGRSDQHDQLMVDVEQDIRWDFEATIDPAAFETINRAYISPYSKLRKAKTRAATLSMLFSNGAWKVRHHDAPDATFPIQLATTAKKPRWMSFIGLEVAAVAQKLVDLKLINTIAIRGNYKGLLQFSIETNVGTYAIHIPAVREGGKLHKLKLLTNRSNIRISQDSVVETDA